MDESETLNSSFSSVLKKQIFLFKAANLLTSGSLDVIRMLPLGTYIPEDLVKELPQAIGDQWIIYHHNQC